MSLSAIAVVCANTSRSCIPRVGVLGVVFSRTSRLCTVHVHAQQQFRKQKDTPISDTVVLLTFHVSRPSRPSIPPCCISYLVGPLFRRASSPGRRYRSQHDHDVVFLSTITIATRPGDGDLFHHYRTDDSAAKKSKGGKRGKHGSVREEIRQLQELLGVDDPNRTPQVTHHC